MIDTLFLYAKANGISIKKHVLYANLAERKIRDGEIDGVTYHWMPTRDDLIRESEDKGGFKTFEVKSQMQGISITDLKDDLENNKIVLIEIYCKEVKTVVDFCKEQGLDDKNVVTIFIKPLSDDDYTFAGCEDKDDTEHKDRYDRDRKMVTRAVMFNKLTNRATEPLEKIIERAGSAYEDIKESVNFDHKIVNHYGEDNRVLWDLLKEFVSVPGGLDLAKNSSKLGGIAKTFEKLVNIVK